ncbi:MAG: hypothetical protein PUE08_02295 [Eubacteriales bacterium]|nr:hypothetical protein [Eubacteriales bacterium]
MQLLLDEKTLRCVWGSTGEFWFSRVDYTVHSSADLGEDNSVSLVENGFVPFITISNEELIRAYIKFLDNKKVSAVFDKLSSEEITETFWKYFNAYQEISKGFDSFEHKFVLDKVVDWCNDNGVEYKIAE